MHSNHNWRPFAGKYTFHFSSPSSPPWLIGLVSAFCLRLNKSIRRPYLNVNTLNERPGLPQGTNIQFFPPYKTGWVCSPAFFFRHHRCRLTHWCRRYRGFLMLHRILCSVCSQPRCKGRWWRIAHLCVQSGYTVNPRSLGAYLARVAEKSATVSLLLSCVPYAGRLIVDEIDMSTYDWKSAWKRIRRS